MYLFSDAKGRVLYVGKAVSLRKRVASYFRAAAALSPRIAKMMRDVADLDVRPTASESDALLLEAQLIKERLPHYNVSFRDDKSYPMLKITRERFPRLVVTRRKLPDGARYFGPYPDAGLMHQAVRFLRRVFPMRTCKTFPNTPCLEYHLGQCLAPCVGAIHEAAYQRIVEDVAAFLEGQRDALLRDLSKRMQQAARRERFEDAARLRDQIRSLTSVIVAKEKSSTAGPLEQLQAALKLPRLPQRIEGFDISNIAGTDAVGSMVVFVGGTPHRSHYRKFRIETVRGISATERGGSAMLRGGDDYQMMREVIRRRYSGTLAQQLPLPDLILVDGGKGQLRAACDEVSALSLSMPIVGLAKRFEQIFLPYREEPVTLLPTSPVLHLVQHVRDEAHRFAVAYHRRLRGRAVSASALDAIPGIGPSRKRALLQRFGTLAVLAQASTDEVASIGRLPKTLAAVILKTLR